MIIYNNFIYITYILNSTEFSCKQWQPQPVGHTISLANHAAKCSMCPPWPQNMQELLAPRFFNGNKTFKFVWDWNAYYRILNFDKKLRTSDCDMANDTLEAQSLAISALRTWTDLPADSALVLQFNVLLHVERGRAQMFQYLRPSIQ